MAQVNTNEGNGENDEQLKLVEWLKENKLLKTKGKCLEIDVTLNEIKSLEKTYIEFSNFVFMH